MLLYATSTFEFCSFWCSIDQCRSQKFTSISQIKARGSYALAVLEALACDKFQGWLKRRKNWANSDKWFNRKVGGTSGSGWYKAPAKGPLTLDRHVYLTGFLRTNCTFSFVWLRHALFSMKHDSAGCLEPRYLEAMLTLRAFFECCLRSIAIFGTASLNFQ